MEERILSPPAARTSAGLLVKQLKALKCRCCGLDKTDPRLRAKLIGLQSLRSQPLTVTSGTRCAKHNARVGGAPCSLHLQGKAVDVAVKAGAQGLLCRQARAAGFRVILPDPQKGYVHLSL